MPCFIQGIDFDKSYYTQTYIQSKAPYLKSQVDTLFKPKNQSLLVGIANTCMAASSIMPQIWLQAILHTSITFTQLMIIWICLAFVSLVFGVVFYPWHNLPDKGEITINDIKALPATLCEKIPLVKVGKEYPTISQKFRESGSFLTSPMFYIHMVSFAMGNCMTTLTINIANDILRAGSKL